ncbi:MAG: alpha/beta hydrolase family protein [Armatimonadota bacterium]
MDPAAEYCHTPRILEYLHGLYDREYREFTFEGAGCADVRTWQAEARPALRRLLGIVGMEARLSDYSPVVELQEPERCDGYTRCLGRIETEPGWPVEFWLLRPEGEGPFPLAVMPHGHEPRGHDTYAGVHGGEQRRLERIRQLDADVAVQAVRRGFVSIAVNTRGFESNCIPDLNERHDGRDCHSQFIHALLAGRTAIGERVWDLQRIVDWAIQLPDVREDRIIMTGNSGGGMATSYAAACDTRVAVAVPSCSFAPYVGQNGLAHHCDCNAVPGIYTFGEFSDVVGLIAPRHLLVVHGSEDPLFSAEEVDRAVAQVRDIYEAAGVPERFEHRRGPEGHRFYADLMWPWIQSALA